MQHKSIIAILAGISLTLVSGGIVSATPSPNGPGQPGAPTTTCGSVNISVTPGGSTTSGGSASASGSAFNSSGTAGLNYAGNPNTASLANAGSVKAVSQYDIACFQVSASH